MHNSFRHHSSSHHLFNARHGFTLDDDIQTSSELRRDLNTYGSGLYVQHKKKLDFCLGRQHLHITPVLENLELFNLKTARFKRHLKSRRHALDLGTRLIDKRPRNARTCMTTVT
jgi:hypothetical protein